jgi:chromosome segregation ATPase
MSENGQASFDMTFIKDIYSGLARVESKLDSLGDVRDVALEAMSSTKSAHNRLDDERRKTNEQIEGIQEQIKGINKVIFWAATTIIGSLAAGAVGMLFVFAK